MLTHLLGLLQTADCVTACYTDELSESAGKSPSLQTFASIHTVRQGDVHVKKEVKQKKSGLTVLRAGS